MITGGIVKKVTGERMKEGMHQGMDINIRINDVKFDKSKITISYFYEVNYKPDVAKMVLEGEIYFDQTEKEVKSAKEHWEKTNQLPESISSDFLTSVTYTCSAIGTLVAFAVNVNAPINVPRARIGPAPQGAANPAG